VTQNPFPEWLEEVAADEIVVNAADIKAECFPNMWSFSLSFEMAEATTIQDVKDFVLKIVRARADQLQERGFPPKSMVFYCWHDEQAAQLRFSLVSASHGHLPFGATLQSVEKLETIIGSWFNNPYLEGIPWDEFVEVDPNDLEPEDEDEGEPYVLQVWSTLI
jgi:hypothetical protein